MKLLRMTTKALLIIIVTLLALALSLSIGIGLGYKIQHEEDIRQDALANEIITIDLSQGMHQLEMQPMIKEVEIAHSAFKIPELTVEEIAYQEWIIGLEFTPVDIITICETGLYDIDNVGLISGLSVEEWDAYLVGTGLEGYAQEIYDIEHLYSVNGFFAIATSVNEVGWLPSEGNLIYWIKKNAFNIGAFNKNPYYYAKTFDTVGASVIHFGGMIRYNYLNEDGDYHKGTSVRAINTKYAQLDDGSHNPQWGYVIKSVMKRLASK